MTEKNLRQRIYRIIRIGYVGDVPSRLFDIVIAVAILLNLFIIFFETFDASVKFLPVLNCIEFATIIIFTIEYILRLVTADYAYPDKKTFSAALVAFIFSLYGLIDLVSFLPYWLLLAFPAASIPAGAVAFRMLRVVRILRLFRVNRYYDAFNVITDVIKEKKNQIASAVFIILMLVMAASIIMYNLEHKAQPEAFRNAFSGIWWAVSTLLTVGYGDIYPVTAAGRSVGIILAFLGVGIVAIPTGILSAGFVQQYTKIKDLAGVSDELPIGYTTVEVNASHRFCGMKVSDVAQPGILEIPVIIRANALVVPDADTVICEDDRLIVSSLLPEDGTFVLGEVAIHSDSEWIGAQVVKFDSKLDTETVLIKRGGTRIVPNKDDIIMNGDLIVVASRSTGGKM